MAARPSGPRSALDGDPSISAAWSLPQPAPPRRDRVRQQQRQQTLDEIEQHAFEIIDAGGLQELSLAALAKAMGMSAARNRLSE